MAGVRQAEVAVGKRYRVRIGNRLAEVEVVGIETRPRWRCHVRTMDTNRTILVRGVGRLRPMQSPYDRMLAARQAREDAAREAAVEGAGWVEVDADTDAAANVRSRLLEEAEVQAGLRRFGRMLGDFLR